MSYLKHIVPYEQSEKLRKLGFDEECLHSYTIREHNLQLNDFGSEASVVQAPTYDQAFDWFREKYNLDSTILPTFSTKYVYRLYKQQSKSKTQIYGDYMGKEYKTYEEARLECLKKLIELCKKH